MSTQARPLLLKALKEHSIPLGSAIDFGVGGGQDTHHLLKLGYHVTAIDNFKEFLTELSLHEANQPYLDKLSIIHADFEKINWDTIKSVDLFVALYSLGFVQPKSFHTVWRNIVNHIKPAGFFVGQLYTQLIKNIQENGYFVEEGSSVPFMTKKEIQNLFTEFEVLYFEDSTELYKTLGYQISLDMGAPIYSIIAQKKS